MVSWQTSKVMQTIIEPVHYNILIFEFSEPPCRSRVKQILARDCRLDVIHTVYNKTTNSKLKLLYSVFEQMDENVAESVCYKSCEYGAPIGCHVSQVRLLPP